MHHESCARADAYATALMVLGPDEGVRFAQEADLAALLLVYNSDTVTESMTDAFAQLLETRSAQAGPWVRSYSYRPTPISGVTDGPTISKRLNCEAT